MKPERGFSLVELLAVLTALGMLGSLAWPALRAGQSEAGKMKCASNLAQLGKGMLLFAADNQMTLPQTMHESDSWTNSLQPYIGKNLILTCPCDEVRGRTRSYAMNDYLSSAPCGAEYLSALRLTRLLNVERSSQTVFFAELSRTYGTGSVPDHLHLAEFDGGDIPPAVFQSYVGVERHGGKANYLFLDGHVEALPWDRVQILINQPGARFIDPRK